jgi:hypothetical protein
MGRYAEESLISITGRFKRSAQRCALKMLAIILATSLIFLLRLAHCV